jgi:hypothetical protein
MERVTEISQKVSRSILGFELASGDLPSSRLSYIVEELKKDGLTDEELLIIMTNSSRFRDIFGGMCNSLVGEALTNAVTEIIKKEEDKVTDIFVSSLSHASKPFDISYKGPSHTLRVLSEMMEKAGAEDEHMKKLDILCLIYLLHTTKRAPFERDPSAYRRVVNRLGHNRDIEAPLIAFINLHSIPK